MYQDEKKLERFTKMPFGKHRGKRIDQLSMSYLKWMLNNMTDGYLRASAHAAYNNLTPPDPASFVKLYFDPDDSDLVVIDAPFKMIEEIKAIDGRQWDGVKKQWTVPRSSKEMVYRFFPKAVLIGELGKKWGALFARQMTIADYYQQRLATMCDVEQIGEYTTYEHGDEQHGQ